jgi:uncharacterized membrane protein YphA (DoxX/SURF4 family)
MQFIRHTYELFLYNIQRLSPVVLLAFRLWIANIFWASGVLKVTSWDNTLTLFMYEHPVPFLPVPVAAVLGTFFEIVCPVLLALGLATRLATLPLIAMTLVINFTYLEATEHYYWLLLLSSLLVHGAGCLSLDQLVDKRYGAKKAS